ncbi:MAG: hypothetical protein ABEJ88_06530 [Halobacterium sp.]
MPRTVTVRASTLVALALVVAGGTTFVVAAQQSPAPTPEPAGFSVSPTDDNAGTAVNASALPRVQRAVFLLAVDPGSYGAYYTSDEQQRTAIRSLPDAVRYDGVVYDVGEATGHPDTVPLPLREWAGLARSVLGVFVFLGAQFAEAARGA